MSTDNNTLHHDVPRFACADRRDPLAMARSLRGGMIANRVNNQIAETIVAKRYSLVF
jgi:hypothetical protein